ncbi:MAG TPA: fatty acid-binding protein DegV [Clostridium sp.]|nr:fatty acid-binding protein DegV [Clostridium sp.]
MRDFIISTDSTADLSLDYIRENNIGIYPLYYNIDGIEYVPGICDMPVKEFYENMQNGKMPTTSAANPKYVMEQMRKAVSDGYDVLHISLSSGLSSSYNNTAICAMDIMDEYEESNIKVIDSLCATVGQGLLVYKAVEMKKEGKTIDEIAEWLNENKKYIVHQFIVDDLFHLVRGGRVTKSAAFVGTVLKVQPILFLNDEGKIEPMGKIRGRKKALNTLADNIEEKTKNFPLDEVFISHADCIEEAEYVAERIKNKYGVKNIVINDICPTVGAHTGKGVVVAAYFGNER